MIKRGGVIFLILSFFVTAQVNILWKFNAGGAVYQALALSPEGLVFFVNEKGILYCLDLQGKQRWKLNLGSEPKSYPVIDLEGRIFVLTKNNDIAVVRKDGILDRKVEVREVITSPPAISSDGIMYFAVGGGKLKAVDTRKFTTLWEFKAKDIIKFPPAIGIDGTVYFGSYDDHFYAVTKDGDLAWKLKLEVPPACGAAIGPEHTVYVATKHYYLLAIDGRKGKIRWRHKFNGTYPVSPPVVASDGTLFVTTRNGVVHAFDYEGDVIKEFPTKWELNVSPLITSNDVVLLAGGDAFLYNFSSALQPLWNFKLPFPVETQAVLSPKGLLIVAALDGNIYAIQTEAGGMNLKAYWPRFQADNRNTGQALR